MPLQELTRTTRGLALYLIFHPDANTKGRIPCEFQFPTWDQRTPRCDVKSRNTLGYITAAGSEGLCCGGISLYTWLRKVAVLYVLMDNDYTRYDYLTRSLMISHSHNGACACNTISLLFSLQTNLFSVSRIPKKCVEAHHHHWHVFYVMIIKPMVVNIVTLTSQSGRHIGLAFSNKNDAY